MQPATRNKQTPEHGTKERNVIIGTILITLLLVATLTVSAVILASVAIAALKTLPRQPANNVCRTKSAA